MTQNKYYISKHHGIISNNPMECIECETFKNMIEISKEEAEELLKIRDKNNEGIFHYWNRTDIVR